MRRKPPRFDTKARRSLAVRLDGFGAQTDLAKKLKVNQGAISRWIKGDARPETYLRDAVAIVFPEIPAIDWRTDEEIRFLEWVTAKAA